jgi:hypothetical protein
LGIGAFGPEYFIDSSVLREKEEEIIRKGLKWEVVKMGSHSQILLKDIPYIVCLLPVSRADAADSQREHDVLWLVC